MIPDQNGQSLYPFSDRSGAKTILFGAVHTYLYGYYLTIIPRAELAIIISYPTSASGIIVLLKTPTIYPEFFPTSFVKTTDFQHAFNFEQTLTVTIFGEHGNGSYTVMAKPIRAPELHYPMI